MNNIYLEVDGKPVLAKDCTWLQFAPCGCVCGVSMAASGGDVHMTGEDAFNWDTPKVVRDRDRRLGFTYQLVTTEHYRAEWFEKFKVSCPCTPTWGIDPIPMPDGWTWKTTDSGFGRQSHRRHIVPNDAGDDWRVSFKALCGKDGTSWRDTSDILSDLAECTKCEKRARETSPVLVPVSEATA